ncbi:SubName: Full=Uncharacterized protein {ECO:0000313/EMBL:CCA75395.1} [Serendipita indica DSM 11827]|uniref:Uncharacterized protein n=1 Tax=Serendipita indica (strain DSM 11827) TaxID=1109443 RepID=G4TVQ2_SERID|nr:SubName: Full=Uncharacterized protein {ECO:0000313/EMBL:CCA75395.1} [Serendipita indica DSM 11827]CCA75395.1 hypothetical protein PIIN_09378 [Serendipita indica DSM 11827]
MSTGQNNITVSPSTSTTLPMTPAHVPPPTGHAPNVALVAPNTPQVLAQAPFTNNGPLLQPSQPSTTNGADPTPTEAVVTTYEFVQTQWNGPNGAFSGFDRSSEPFF